jgi:uncharacterized protein YabN with tetrapyrrole methylase and pyrophosphatase domain
MDKLLKIMQELREKCPWDQQQTPMSLTKYAIEEAYEVEAAVRQGNIDEIRNELAICYYKSCFNHKCLVSKVLLTFKMWLRQ